VASVSFSESVGGDGSTVTDDASPVTGLAQGGHRERFVPALAQTVAVAQHIIDQVDTAVAAAGSAAASATEALNAPGWKGTSTTNHSVTTGAKSFTTQTGKSFAAGQFLVIAVAASPQIYMMCQITGYVGGTGVLTVNVQYAIGGGSFSDWSISLTAGPVGGEVPTLAALKSVDTSQFVGGETIGLTEKTSGAANGYPVVFRNGDRSPEVAASVNDNWIVPNDREADGSEGAYQRSSPILDLSGLLGSFILPSEYGAPTDGLAPASAGIQAAIDAVESGTRSGVVWVDRPYAIDYEIVHKRGVTVMGNSSFNRRTFPNTFGGNRLYPHASLVANSAALDSVRLWRVGTFGDMDNNPNGGVIQGVCFDGRDVNGDHVLDLTGLLVRDTSDFQVLHGYMGGFDRTDNTGFGMMVEGTGEGNCFGTIVDHTIFSNSQHGLFFTGLGTTDMRISQNLFVGVTRALTLGYDDRDTENVIQQGGAGTQLTANHYTYTGMPEPGWFIRNGGQGGTLMAVSEYYDQHGVGTPIRLGNSKAKINNCHFLCAATQNAPGLIRVQTAGSQQLICTQNTVDAKASAIKSLVYYSAKTGTPTGGIIALNEVYGGPAAWLGHAIDQTLAPIANIDDGAFFKGINVLCP